ncbi:hypothetical protein Pint_31758 [Pistacia integerrima]|uniref:Uncharacterized protein n=1 Tax=Pistacia integerrima TaxID=434235 RepID=A0ACC0XNY5_9ROSI|nr:hypothetical protein Pint_31758 [Pistacia integerrima]
MKPKKGDKGKSGLKSQGSQQDLKLGISMGSRKISVDGKVTSNNEEIGPQGPMNSTDGDRIKINLSNAGLEAAHVATDTEFSSFQQAKFMVDIDVQIPSSFDPFAETKSSANSKGGYVPLRVQQRNGKKSITTIDVNEDYPKIPEAKGQISAIRSEAFFIPWYELYITYGGIFSLTFGPKVVVDLEVSAANKDQLLVGLLEELEIDLAVFFEQQKVYLVRKGWQDP